MKAAGRPMSINRRPRAIQTGRRVRSSFDLKAPSPEADALHPAPIVIRCMIAIWDRSTGMRRPVTDYHPE
jgi:hypothetical protein